MMIKQLFAGLLVFCYCLTLINAEPTQETEALPFGRDFSMSLNPIDTYPPQQLQQRILPVGLFLVPRVISLGQQVNSLQQSLTVGLGSFSAFSSVFAASLSTLSSRVSGICPSISTLLLAAMTNPVGGGVAGSFPITIRCT